MKNSLKEILSWIGAIAFVYLFAVGLNSITQIFINM